MIVWNDNMATGISEIDAQHRELIDRFNQLDIALAEGRGREEIGETLGFVLFYTEWHFGREERCMEEYGCPVAEVNKKQHAWFLDEFKRLFDKYHNDDTDSNLILETFENLESWIVNHITRTDSGLRGCSSGYAQQGAD